MIEKTDYVILVDENDTEIGYAEKLEAHKNGLLHRAFSIFLVNSIGEILLQQRAISKYHSPNLWSNSCCSHPMPNENILEAANRRLMEELGIEVSLSHKFQFKYFVRFENGLSEHEIDHVLFGSYSGLPEINPNEAINYRWVTLEQVEKEIQLSPNSFTFWFKFILENYGNTIKMAMNENL